LGHDTEHPRCDESEEDDPLTWPLAFPHASVALKTRDVVP
jgi:hypothetical protein